MDRERRDGGAVICSICQWAHGLDTRELISFNSLSDRLLLLTCRVSLCIHLICLPFWNITYTLAENLLLHSTLGPGVHMFLVLTESAGQQASQVDEEPRLSKHLGRERGLAMKRALRRQTQLSGMCGCCSLAGRVFSGAFCLQKAPGQCLLVGENNVTPHLMRDKGTFVSIFLSRPYKTEESQTWFWDRAELLTLLLFNEI